MVVPMNIQQFLWRAQALYGNKMAIYDEDMTLTYRQFSARVQQLSRALQSCGVKAGDRVAWLGYNNHPLLEAYFGVVASGAILVPLNIRLLVSELAPIIQDADPKVLVFDSDFETTARTILQNHPDLLAVEIQIEVRHPQYLGYEDFLAHESPEPADLPELDENSVAEIFYTSGTTGVPKGVALTHRNLYMNALQILATSDLSDASVLLHTIPLFHVNGWGAPHYITAIGATHIMLRKFIPDRVLTLIEHHQVTHALMVPTMVQSLNLARTQNERDLSSLVSINVGGAPSPQALVSETQTQLNTEYMGGYGLSETCPVVSVAYLKSTLTTAPAEQQERWRSTAGLPLVGIQISVADSHGLPQPWDGQSAGELRVRANTVMQGYWHNPSETARVIQDGWLYTGDIATIDPEGYIHIVDRRKDIIISGGENISSSELEDVLYAYPGVLECCVIGRPDPVWGEAPHAVVVPKPGTVLNAPALLEFVNTRVAGFKRIKSVAFVDALPKTGTGKIQKQQIRRQFSESQADGGPDQ